MKSTVRALALAVIALPIIAPTALAAAFTGWGAAVNVESIAGTDPSFNTAATEGCPSSVAQRPEVYMASNRPGGQGGLDIWVASRASTAHPWGAPVNPGPEINTIDNEFCPSPAQHGKGFMFVSNRPGGCGGDDIYLTRFRFGHWAKPHNAGCAVNSPANEASPYRHRDGHGREYLYFSSSRPGGYTAEAEGATSGDIDLFVSRVRRGSIGTPRLVDGVNSASDVLGPTSAVMVTSCSSTPTDPEVWVDSIWDIDPWCKWLDETRESGPERQQRRQRDTCLAVGRPTDPLLRQRPR